MRTDGRKETEGNRHGEIDGRKEIREERRPKIEWERHRGSQNARDRVEIKIGR